ncbi:class I SAM-dependent methyltransferase [Alteromonas sp. ASW11-130]|uniref:class I SAM-dependent methyltransferase n=1 Tax=Alteromonas sp. ASW11-130 TaxID=3015775 RepID=UPI00224191F2|nr:class I SAM-dependent methyltransferase [Alteromonas sp. ASW11-130]MCW8091225.1 class I SAM-dependent methyltransferase [Alteromonas sp. ASW11-130]
MFQGESFQPSNTPVEVAKYEESSYEIGRVELLKDLIPSGLGKSAIDIGCGPGFFSSVLSNKGWETTAIDTDFVNIESAKNHAYETHLGDALSLLPDLPESQYDLVLCLELIEHMPKPLGQNLLKEIIKVLKPGGGLIISTPNKFSPEGLGGYYWGEKIRGHGKWTAWDSTHIHIYSSSEIIQLLKTSGFVVDRITGYYYEGTLPVIGRWKLPLKKSTKFPLNQIGFNIVVECHKK